MEWGVETEKRVHRDSDMKRQKRESTETATGRDRKESPQ